MCLLLSFNCCGSCSASPTPGKKQTKTKTKKPEQVPKQEQKQEQQIQQQQPTPTPINYHSDLQLNDLSRSDFHMTNSLGNGSMASLPISMSLSLMPLPHPMTNSSTLSSWAAEEELYDMDEYEERTPTRWTAWWLHGASASDLNLRGFDI